MRSQFQTLTCLAAIHYAAGPELFAECQKLSKNQQGERCPTGKARITRYSTSLSWTNYGMLLCSKLSVDREPAGCYLLLGAALGLANMCSFLFPALANRIRCGSGERLSLHCCTRIINLRIMHIASHQATLKPNPLYSATHMMSMIASGSAGTW